MKLVNRYQYMSRFVPQPYAKGSEILVFELEESDIKKLKIWHRLKHKCTKKPFRFKLFKLGTTSQLTNFIDEPPTILKYLYPGEVEFKNGFMEFKPNLYLELMLLIS